MLVATFLPGRKLKTFYVAFLLPDCKTSYGRSLIVPSAEQLLRVIGRLGGDVEALRHQTGDVGAGKQPCAA